MAIRTDPTKDISISPRIRNEILKLSPEYREEFCKIYEKKSRLTRGRVTSVMFLLGFNYAYLGRWWMQIVFWITFGGFLVWWFINLERSVGLILDYNRDLAIKILKDINNDNR